MGACIVRILPPFHHQRVKTITRKQLSVCERITDLVQYMILCDSVQTEEPSKPFNGVSERLQRKICGKQCIYQNLKKKKKPRIEATKEGKININNLNINSIHRATITSLFFIN